MSAVHVLTQISAYFHRGSPVLDRISRRVQDQGKYRETGIHSKLKILLESWGVGRYMYNNICILRSLLGNVWDVYTTTTVRWCPHQAEYDRCSVYADDASRQNCP